MCTYSAPTRRFGTVDIAQAYERSAGTLARRGAVAPEAASFHHCGALPSLIPMPDHHCPAQALLE